MAKLKASERAKLPDSAFAYIDSSGNRRLPIHDEAHVRNALARFERVAFEDDAARERARKRLLNAAKKFGIVPVGFIAAQLQRERVYAGAADPRTLPTGVVTFLFTDMEDSTALLRRLGDGYGDVLNGVRRIVRQAVVRHGGREVDARADEFFAAFERPAAAIEAAVAFQETLARRPWRDGLEVRVRVGIHSGQATLTEAGYIGLAVHAAARICMAAHGGQILLSGETKTALKETLPAGLSFRALGRHRLPGLDRSHTLFQVEAEGLLADFPVPRTR
ncbi:MAG: adenylate/guanylate cyclase domain-containing protein [Actinomycetota bacterium]|nr:adenylate/guanylate cyclase domain-containing protein [Actinomycetota bacterium]